ncbi:MAG TPA: 3D-(3,5/4)-trihydroxycyclohexane-1,2-dione acylhydrolase (decyclizing) [Solirubrobacteraceae bacterium]
MNAIQTAASTRSATLRLTAGQALVRFLQVQWSERDGVRRRLVPGVFGIFGHGNVCGIGPALEEDRGRGLRFYQPKNEQAMVHTAIGYAKVNKLLSTFACTASIGPGSTNMVTGAATATVNRIPVLLLPSDTFANRRQGPVMQALEHASQADLTVNDCFRPVSRFFDRITRPEQLLGALPEAMRVLLDPAEAGAVTLSLHQDVQGEGYEFPIAFFEPRTWRVVRRPPADEELQRAVDALRAAERPLVVAGGGVHYADASEELGLLSRALGLPVAESSAGKGALRAGALAMGGLGRTGTRAANALAREADVVLCVGTRMIDLTTGSHSVFQDPGVRFIAINTAAADAHKLGAISVVADAKLAVAALTERLRACGWSAPERWRIQALEERARWESELFEDLEARVGERMSQGQALRVLNEVMRAEDHLVVASGTPHVDVHKLWDATHGGRIHMEVGFSTMGHEIPAGLGVRLAAPDAGEVYVVIGDGTYLMGHTELVTAAQEGANITVLVFVNGGYQSIHGLQNELSGRSFGLEFRTRDTDSDALAGPLVEVDYAANARSYGCAAFEVNTLDELHDALEEARVERGPTVIVCHVEPRRYVLDSACWWDVGVPEHSDRQETLGAAAAHARGRAKQRFYG